MKKTKNNGGMLILSLVIGKQARHKLELLLHFCRNLQEAEEDIKICIEEILATEDTRTETPIPTLAPVLIVDDLVTLQRTAEVQESVQKIESLQITAKEILNGRNTRGF